MPARIVLTICPVTDKEVATHAFMTKKQLLRFRGELSLFCGECRQAHVVDYGRLFLDGGEAPLEYPTYRDQHDEPEASAQTDRRHAHEYAGDIWRS